MMLPGGWGRALAAVLVGLGSVVASGGPMDAASASSAAGASSTRSADGGGGMAISVSPSTGLVDGQSVDYTVTGASGVPGDYLSVMECDSSITPSSTQAQILQLCTGGPTVQDPPDPST